MHASTATNDEAWREQLLTQLYFTQKTKLLILQLITENTKNDTPKSKIMKK